MVCDKGLPWLVEIGLPWLVERGLPWLVIKGCHGWLREGLHCKNCGVLCPPNEQHTIGGISHQPLKVCLAHLIWCARS